MARIDQTILIIAPVESVWHYLTDPALMPHWNRLARQISVLSTRPTGPGARRRCVDVYGRTTVEEIVTWLDNIGYEYTQIDGAYHSLKGRYRLQAVPEGTTVSWNLDYELKGMLTGMRSLFGAKRAIRRLMLDSLKDLKKQIERSGVKVDKEKHARSAMQAAPDADARAARGVVEFSRYNTPAESSDGAPPKAFVSSSMILDDSIDIPDNYHNPRIEVYPKSDALAYRPSKTTADEPAEVALSSSAVENKPLAPAAALNEPLNIATASSSAELSKISEPPIAEEDTKPRRNVLDLERAIDSLKADVSDRTPLASPTTEMSIDMRDHRALTVPIAMVAPDNPPNKPTIGKDTDGDSLTSTQTMEVTMSPNNAEDQKLSPPTSLPERVPTPPYVVLSSLQRMANEPLEDLPPTTDDDTGQRSIWDVFMMQRPSEQADNAFAQMLSKTGPMETVPPPSTEEVPMNSLAEIIASAQPSTSAPTIKRAIPSVLKRRSPIKVRPVGVSKSWLGRRAKLPPH